MGVFKNKKIIIFLVVIVLIALSLTGKILYDQSKKYTLEQVTSIDYLLVEDGGRFGVINKAGEIVITPIYDEIQIPNPSKPIFICMNNYNEEKDEYDVTVLNEKSEKILYEYVMVKAVDIQNSTSTIPYEKSVLKYKQDGKWGLIDFKGKKITKPIYEEINGLTYREGLLKVRKDSKYGVINIKGTTIIKNKYDNIKCDGYFNQNQNYNNAGFIVSITTSEGYRYGYLDYNGREILKTEYNDISRILDKNDDKNAYILAFKNGMAAVYKNNQKILNHEYEDVFYNKQYDLLIVQKNSKQGVVNIEGKNIIPIEYLNIIISEKYINAQKDDKVEIFDIAGNNKNIKGYISISSTENENYNIAINENDEYQIIDNSGNIITKQIYKSLKSIDGKNFIAQKDSKFGIISITEETKMNFEYDVIQVLSNTQVIQTLKFEGNIAELYDFEMNKIGQMEKANIYINNNYIKLISANNIQYFSLTGKQLKNNEIFNNKLYAIQKDGKWGFSDKDGKIVIQPIYDMVTEFNEYGFAGIKQEGKWGSIDSEGQVIKEPVYILSDNLPEFIKEYYKVDYGYGIPYYTSNII